MRWKRVWGEGVEECVFILFIIHRERLKSAFARLFAWGHTATRQATRGASLVRDVWPSGAVGGTSPLSASPQAQRLKRCPGPLRKMFSVSVIRGCFYLLLRISSSHHQPQLRVIPSDGGGRSPSDPPNSSLQLHAFSATDSLLDGWTDPCGGAPGTLPSVAHPQ